MNQNRFTTLFTILLLFFSFWALQSTAQVINTVDNNSTNKDWLEMIQDPNVNFYEAQSAFNKYWANRTDYKGNGYKVFKRWEYINETRILPDGKLQDAGYIKSQYDTYMSKLDGSSSASGNWTIQGPTQYFINNTGQPTGMGRVNAIAFHPTDVNTIYIGAPSGGIWKTTNGGTTWENLANDLPKLGVSSILIHPSDPNIIYIGTGDRDGGDAPGIGVFKSVDGGNTWMQINNTMGNVIVGDMLMLPSDPNTIIAATSGGIFKTTNGGATWALKSSANNFKDIQFKPGDPTVVYAVRITTPSRFYRSTDTGGTWTQITSGIPTSGIGSRMVIGTSPANPNYVYLVQINSTDGTFANLLRSTDAGLSFTSMSSSPNIMGYNCDGSGTASQATYDLCINVDPTNADIVYVGGINTWKSIDGGATWAASTNWSSNCGGTATAVHADHHVLEWNPLNGALYLGHDGGISYTADGGSTWIEITGGLPISQIYRIGQGASNNNYILIGLQDNGSGATTDGSTFYTTRGGDGTECLIDYNNANYSYNTYVNGAISRSSTGPIGSYTNIGSEGSNGIDEAGPWVLPYFLHKTDPNTMFAGYKNVWRTNNVRAVSASSVSWTKISTGETSTCKALEQSAADPNVIYVVRSGAIKRTDNANDAAASVTWTACTLPFGQTPTYLATHPTDANIVYASAGNSVYKSIDKGMSWTDMDPNSSLPDLIINCLVYEKNSNEGIYVGNQTGVWYKNATMTNWVLFSNGLPPVDVRELEIFYDPSGTQNRLKAATYGRGLWQSDLYESGVLNPANFTATVVNIDKIDLTWDLTAGNNVILAYSTSPTFGTPVNGTAYAASASIPGGGTVLYNGNAVLFHHNELSANTTYYYKLWSYDGSTAFSTGTTANATTTLSVADFTADATLSCTGSLTVNFTDASTSPYNSWAWDIDNNGTIDYTTQNPTHTYSNPGLYSVKLTINSGFATITKENLVLVMNNEPTANTGCILSSNANSGNGYGIGIYRFALGNIDYSTSNNDGYYQNYACSKSTPLELNKSYDITIRTGTANNEGAKVYIDYNDNRTFESEEEVVSFPANKEGIRTLPFTTPSSGVVLDKGLRIRVLSKFSGIPSTACDIDSYGQAEDYTVYFLSEANWTGLTSSNWTTPGNWNINSVPVTGAKINIPSGAPNYPVLTSNVTCGDLTIESGASVTINSGAGLTVNGTLLNSAGNTGLVIKSGGSLIESTTGVAATVERVFTNGFWHLISVPNNSATANTFLGDYLQSWDEQNAAWNDIVSPATGLVPLQGYGLWSVSSATERSFAGTLNTGSISKAVTVTELETTENDGANLLGNPYPCYLDWDGFRNTWGAVYYWNGSGYDSWNNGGSGSRYVPPMQGFFIIAPAAGTFQVTNANKAHSTGAYYKSSDNSAGTGLILTTKGETYADKLYISFNDEANEGFDLQHDAFKLLAFTPGVSELYSFSGDTKLSIDVRPECELIPLGFRNSLSGTYKIGIDEKSDNLKATLEDTKTGTFNDLLKGPYTFNYLAGEAENRFKLHIATVGKPDIQASECNIFSFDKSIYIGLPLALKGDIGIFNIAGQQVASRTMATGQVKINLSTTGIYVVKVVTNKETITRKVCIR